MKAPVIVAAGLLLGVCWSLSAAAKVFEIPDGDVDALNAAIESANESGEPAIIVLAENGHYRPRRQFTAVEGQILIDGRGALIQGAANWRGPRVFGVFPTGSLVLENIHFGDFEVQGPLVGNAEGGIVSNGGHTTIRNSTLSNAVNVGFRISIGSAIMNREGATLLLENVTIAMNIAGGSFTRQGAIYNRSGDVTLVNSEVTGNEGMPGGIVNVLGGTVTLVNSIVADNEGADCQGEGFISLGHNIDGDGSCSLDQASDMPETDPRFGTFGDHGGLVPTVALEPDSPAIGAADSGRCPPVDARGFVRAEARQFDCDIGAYERDASTYPIGPELTASWFHPPQDGHGFNIEVLGPDRDQVLAYWYTYDAEGAPQWLLGVAPIEGHRAPMVLYGFRGMRFGEFDPAANKETPWGTLTLYFGSCERGAATWQPLDPALPAGGMPLARLSFVETLGCGEG